MLVNTNCDKARTPTVGAIKKNLLSARTTCSCRFVWFLCGPIRRDAYKAYYARKEIVRVYDERPQQYDWDGIPSVLRHIRELAPTKGERFGTNINRDSTRSRIFDSVNHMGYELQRVRRLEFATDHRADKHSTGPTAQAQIATRVMHERKPRKNDGGSTRGIRGSDEDRYPGTFRPRFNEVASGRVI